MTHLINDCLLWVNSPVVHRGVVALASPGTPRDCQKSSDSFFPKTEGTAAGAVSSILGNPPHPPPPVGVLPPPAWRRLASCL